jgi:hypothetical protein
MTLKVKPKAGRKSRKDPSLVGIKIESDFALIDIKKGRKEIAKIVAAGYRIPFVICGYIQNGKSGVGHDDGESVEFAATITDGLISEPVYTPADKLGRPYATPDDLKAGDKVDVDAGLTCMEPGRKTVKAVTRGKDKGALYIECDDGKHFLSGQLETENGVRFYMGIHKVGA